MQVNAPRLCDERSNGSQNLFLRCGVAILECFTVAMVGKLPSGPESKQLSPVLERVGVCDAVVQLRGRLGGWSDRLIIRISVVK